MRAFETAITGLLGIQHPVLSAPMARVSGGELAAAVTRAGGLGFIGGGYGNRQEVLQAFKDAQGEAVGIGFISWALEQQPDLLDVAIEKGATAVFLSFGSIASFARRIRRAKIPLIAQIQTVADARIAVSEGADAIVAQGAEAGGHGGVRGTFALVPAVVDAVSPIPVLAAGGVADGRGLAAALMLGASGVVCGTAFYSSVESLAHINAKNAACSGSGDNTARHGIFDIVRRLDWPAPWTNRALENDLSLKWRNRIDELKESVDVEAARYAAAVAQGDVSAAAVIVGEAIDLVKSIEPAEVIVKRMVRGARSILEEYQFSSQKAKRSVKSSLNCGP